MDAKPSTSEDNGIAALPSDAVNIYSVGISTAGVAEIRMAEANPGSKIVATTIDKEGLDFTQKALIQEGYAEQIETKFEDISEPLPYEDGLFDYVYARLVLHYLPKDKLQAALKEIRRALKPGGKFFVLVRSIDCPDAKRTDAVYNEQTGMTDFTTDTNGKRSRFFHTEDSIRSYLEGAGFTVEYTKAYDEYLFSDFKRTEKNHDYNDNVIEVLAH